MMLALLLASSASPDFVIEPGLDVLPTVLPKLRALPRPLARDIVVQLKAGTHRLTAPLVIDAAAGGDDGGHRVLFTGAAAAAATTASNAAGGAVVSGGIPVLGPWTALDRNVSGGRSVLWSAPLPDGFDPAPIGNRLQLWRADGSGGGGGGGGGRMTLAQSPQHRYVHAEATNITFNGSDIASTYYDFASVHLLLYESWTASYHTLASVNATTRVAQLATHYNAQWANSASGSRYHVGNAREELDADGEFYVDALAAAEKKGGLAKGGQLLLQLSAAEGTPAPGAFVLPGPVELVLLRGNADATVSSVAFEELAFAHTAVESAPVVRGSSAQSGAGLTTAALHLRFASDIAFDRCSVRATGGYALWAEQATRGINLTRSSVADVGAGAVRLGRADSALPRDSEGHVVADNVLADGGHVFHQGCGVLAQAVADTSIAHNEIARFHYTGVSTGWTWGYGPTVTHDIVTTGNFIHDIGMGFLSDMACVYTLGHQPGSAITNNFCSDVQSYNYGGWAYYTDEGSRDELFENNIGTRTKCAGHHQHYGTDNVLRNNIYYAVNVGDVPTPGRPEILMPGTCDTSIRSSSHARNVQSCPHPDSAPSAGCCCHPGCDQGKCSSFTFERNIVFQPPNATSSLVDGTWAGGLDNFTFHNNVYWKAGAEHDAALFNKTQSFAAWQHAGKDGASLFADPRFSNATTFALAAASPALAPPIGFQPIDISTVGPRADAVGAQHALAVPGKPRGVELLEVLDLVHST